MAIDASKLRQLEPIDGDDEHPGKHGLIVALHGTEPGTRWYDTATERDEAETKIRGEWQASRGITGVRPDAQGDVDDK